MEKNMEKNYVGLHNHTDFSILDGYAKVDEYIEAAKSMNMIGIGLADHGTASGLYQLITKATKAGLIPVPGVEFYVAPENPLGAKVKESVFYGPGGKRAPKYDVGGNGRHLHQTVWAYNNKGLQNLFKLTSLSWDPENFYGKPRIDLNMLIEHSEGLIVTTGCPSSEINRRFLLGQDAKAYEYARRLKDVFKDNFYVELMNHDMEEDLERIMMPKLIKLAQDLDIKMIATNDSHYAFQKDAAPHERQLAMQSASKMSEPGMNNGGTRFAFSGPEYHLKTYEDMYKTLPEEIAEEALANTIELTKKCEGITLDYDPHLRPVLEIPEGETSVSYLKKLIIEGFKKKRANASKETKAESQRRVNEEFEVLHSNDFIDYFLVVHDYIDFAHRNGITVGTGRGSVGGSEIAYLLDISDTDPIRFDLLFERFLSPGRGSLYMIEFEDGTSIEVPVSEKHKAITPKAAAIVYTHELNPGDIVVDDNNVKHLVSKVYVSKPGSAPDVDTDFHTEGRQRVIDYVTEKYGKENVANIITFGTYKAKSSFKAICTIYEKPFAEANRVSALIPDAREGDEPTIADLFDPMSQWYAEGEDFRLATEGEEWQEVIEMAKPFDGRISHSGVHPCGLIISSVPLSHVTPTQVRQTDGTVVTQWTYPELESMGLIKMDFLGLDTLDLIDLTVNNIKLAGKGDLDVKKITDGPMDDKKTYELLQAGQTTGVFQLGSTGVKDLLRRAQPTKFMDIAAITALYRPGPMSTNAHNEWADRLNGLNEPIPIHEGFKGTEVEEILKDTAGILIYQEALMQIVTRYANMSAYESDMLRKAMGKKNMGIMMSLKPRFIEGVLAKGQTGELAELLWDTMEGFGQYGFNRCLHGKVLVSVPGEGKVQINTLYKRYEENPNEDIYIDAMFEDGEIRPHKVSKVVKTGRKPLYQVKTKSGRQIMITKDHRLLTVNGYGTIEDGKVAVGNELIIDGEWHARLSPKALKARQNNMKMVNEVYGDEIKERSRKWMTEYQSTLTHEDRVKHQQKVQEENPSRTDNWLKAGRKRLEKLRRDPEWNTKFAEANERARQAKMASGEYVGFGKPTQMKNGEWADSMVEAMAGNYMLERGIEFELHKPVTNSKGEARISDFYVDGLYFEMDGMDRGRQYFVDNKYGEDIPFVYMTPENFGDVIDEAIMKHHIENGDEIVEIVEPRIAKNGKQYTEMSYDIEMDTSGPANFIANGIVSHNSHSVSYAMNAYVAAFLKANYPAEFMAASIQQEKQKSKLAGLIQESVTMGLKIGPVNVNSSTQLMSVPNKALVDTDYDIVYGFMGVNRMNAEYADAIVNEREANGLYKDIPDFVERVNNHVKVTPSMISTIALAGAFDSFGVSRKSVVDNSQDLVKSINKTANKGASLFALASVQSADVTGSIELDGPDYDYVEKIKLEAEAIGLFVSGHPVDKLGAVANSYNATTIAALRKNATFSKEPRYILGTITELKSKTNRSGRRSIAINIDDSTGTQAVYLPAKVVNEITKGEALERLSKNPDRPLPESMQKLVDDETIGVSAPLEKYEVYLFEVRVGGGQNFRLGVTNVTRLQTMPNGSLPFDIKCDTKKHLSDVSAIVNKHSKKNNGIYIRVNGEQIVKKPVLLSREMIIELENAIGVDNVITKGV